MTNTIKTLCLTGVLLCSLAISQNNFADSLYNNQENTNIEIKLTKAPLPGKFPEVISSKKDTTNKYLAAEDRKSSSLPKTGEEYSKLALTGTLTTIVTLFVFWLTNKKRKEE